MRIDGLTLSQMERIAQQTGVELYNVRVHPLRPTHIECGLRPPHGAQTYRKRSFSGRQCWAVCYHGHYEFLRRVFAANSQARVKAGRGFQVAYNGKAEFEEKAPTVGEANVGSMGQPVQFRDACDCEA